MDVFFLRHPVLWWRSLSVSDRRELVAVLIGACIVLLTTWLGVRRWWRRWKADPNNPDEGGE